MIERLLSDYLLKPMNDTFGHDSFIVRVIELMFVKKWKIFEIWCFRRKQWLRHERKNWTHVFVNVMFWFPNLSIDDLSDFSIVLYRLRNLFLFLWIFSLSLLHCPVLITTLFRSHYYIVIHKWMSSCIVAVLVSVNLKNNWILLTRQGVQYRSWILTRALYYILRILYDVTLFANV